MSDPARAAGREEDETVSGVLIAGALEGGRPTRATLELLGAGSRAAAALGVPLEVALLGFDLEEPAAAALGAYGAAVAWRATHPLLKSYQAEVHLAALEQVASAAAPGALLLAGDAAGRELAPRLAARLGGSLVSEAVDLGADGGRLRFLKPVFGGKAMAWMVPVRGVQMATVKLRAFDPAAPSAGGTAAVRDVPVTLPEELQASRVVDVIREATGGLKLEDARIVVSGGRGLGGPEPFKMLQELASLLGGAVGASRAACDAGWVPAGWQVGQTGKVIAPDLYIAVGISGASQHLAGISNAKHVVAINTDPDAPIFRRATVGIVADYRTVLPALIKELRATLGR